MDSFELKNEKELEKEFEKEFSSEIAKLELIETRIAEKEFTA